MPLLRGHAESVRRFAGGGVGNQQRETMWLSVGGLNSENAAPHLFVIHFVIHFPSHFGRFRTPERLKLLGLLGRESDS